MLNSGRCGWSLGASAYLLLRILVYAVIAGTSLALANTMPQTIGHPKVVTKIETVTVTAERRRENLERAPLTVVAFTADELRRRDIWTQSDLQLVTPGLIVRQTMNRNQQNYSIRGQSVDAYSDSTPAVLGYIDGFQDSATSASSFYDLSSVQVLKGPQGTLFGQNTTGGAVLFTTAKPNTNALEGYGTLRIGNYDWREFKGAINVPLSESLAVRVAGLVNRRSGYVRNLLTKSRLNDDHEDSIRVSVLWRPTRRIESETIGQFDQSTGNGDGKELFSIYSPGQVGPGPDHLPLISTAAFLYSPALDLIAGPGAFEALRKDYPYIPPGGLLQFARQQRGRSIWTVSNNGPLHHSGRAVYLINRTTLNISKALQFKNVIGYAGNINADITDVDGTPAPIIPNYLEDDIWQASEEFLASGKTLDNKLNYVSGLYFSNQIQKYVQSYQTFNLGPIANPIVGPLFGVPSLPLSNTLVGRTRHVSEAIFAQVTYDLNSLMNGLKISGGVRYSWEQIRYLEETGYHPFYPNNVVENSDESAPSWLIGLSYQMDRNLMLYVTQRGSWRSGGFNHNAPPIPGLATAGGNGFLPEKTHDVEIGLKYQGAIGTSAVRLNLDAYNQWVSDIQRVVYLYLPNTGLAGLTYNVPGGGTFRGVEADGEIVPFGWLRLGGNLSIADASYGNPHSATIFGTFVDYDTMADLTKYSGDVYARVILPVPQQVGEMSLRGSIYSQSSMYFTNLGNSNNPGAKIPGYGLVNFGFTWAGVMQSNVSLSLFVKNAFNHQYFVGGLPQGSQLGYNTVLPGEPRFFGMDINYQF